MASTFIYQQLSVEPIALITVRAFYAARFPGGDKKYACAVKCF